MSRKRRNDSHPLHFSRQSIRELSFDRSKHIDHDHVLDFISPAICRNAFNDALTGAHARIQWLWEQLEPADAILATCVDRRQAALGKIPWAIRKIDGLSDTEDLIAEAQVRTLSDFANALIGIEDAVLSLGMASFRHFRRIQLLEGDAGMSLVSTDNWNWCQNGYRGEWRWNPSAAYGSTRGEICPVPEESIITRIVDRPIDQPAMMLVLDRNRSKASWMVFNERYGVPPIFAILPPGISDADRDAYFDFARQCVSNAAGVMPAGSEIKTVTPGSATPDVFRGVIDLSTQELVLRATGGLMTMLTAPGAGTSTDTGSAHQDAFDDLADSEASQIAKIINEAVFIPCLNQWHPGQPHLAKFSLERIDESSNIEAISGIAALASAGYRTDDRQVQDVTGLEVTSINMGMQLNSLRKRIAPTMLWAPARGVFENSIKNKIRSIHSSARDSDKEASKISEPEIQKLLADLLPEDLLSKQVEAIVDPIQAALKAGVKSSDFQNIEKTPSNAVKSSDFNNIREMNSDDFATEENRFAIGRHFRAESDFSESEMAAQKSLNSHPENFPK